MGKSITRGKGLLAFHSVCDYCEVLCEILIFGYHISLISYFLDGVDGCGHDETSAETGHDVQAHTSAPQVPVVPM